ncbi:MAG: hypothetical protein CVT48_03760 [Thermoplasmata archaeon HGW-Thermoplasmata-1]|nr:MAG: hypothetical protein CVT48_03760 [Thermoplasmata archaeon HGW-Thermoplasmata-1]
MINKPMLFSLEECERCDFVKKQITPGTNVLVITYPHDAKRWNVDQLTEAAYYEVFSELQETAPILLLPDGTKVTSVIDIRKKIQEL